MKRVLIVTDYFTPHWTGLSKSIEGLAHLLVSQDIATTVITTQYDSKLKAYEHRKNYTIYRMPYIKRISRTFFSLAFPIKAILLIPQHTTVFINSPCTYILPVSIMCKLLRRRLVIFHQGDLILPKNSNKNRLLEHIFDISTHVGCLLADQVATYSQDYAQHSRILSRYPKKTTVFILPLQFPPHKITRVDRAWRRKMKKLKQSNTTIFGAAGRFVEEKGLDVLFDALILLKKQNKVKNIHILYAGAAMPYEKYLDRYSTLLEQLSQSITFTGLLKSEALSAFYETIDAFVLPSRSECFGLVQAEALHFAKPLIVSDIPGARILVEKTGCGILVPSNSPSQLARALTKMSSSHTLFEREIKQANTFLSDTQHEQALHSFLFGTAL